MKVESIFKSRNTLRSDEMTKVSTILKAELKWLAKEVFASEVKEEKVKRSRAKKYEVSDYEKGWVFEVPMKDVKIVEGEEDGTAE